jgi:DNA-directed RNA polymerase II subunit RPB1
MRNSVKFRIADPETILKQSVVEITSTKTFIQKQRVPDESGVMSLLMGSVSRKMRCATCENDLLVCPGHFGHIKLTEPVYHVGYVKKIVKTLRTFCYWCSRFFRESQVTSTENNSQVGSSESHQTPRKKTRRTSRSSTATDSSFNETADGDHSQGGGHHCHRCNGPVPMYTASGHKIHISWRSGVSKKAKFYRARKAGEQFGRVLIQYEPLADGVEKPGASENLLLLKTIKSLKNAIISVLIVPPPCIRPSGGSDSVLIKNRGLDDLTRILISIVSINNRLADVGSKRDECATTPGKPDNVNFKKKKCNALPTSVSSFSEVYDLLQWTVSSYMNNDVKGEEKSTNRIGGAMRDLHSRLVGKNGLMRRCMNGKRVDYSARSVIVPNIFLDVDEVGVPRTVAETLLKPVTVNAINRKSLEKLLLAGKVKYITMTVGESDDVQPTHGIKLPSKRCTRRVKVDVDNEKRCAELSPLQIGWVCERSIEDGDYVAMNRHPSLHKHSMLGHRSRILPPGYLAFQMNPAVCPPYNADFDGDEMNLHLPTTLDGEVELQQIMAVSKNVISPANSRLTFGAVQDCSLGMWLLSEPVELKHSVFCQLVFAGDGIPKLDCNSPKDGNGVISSILPLGFSMNTHGENGVLIQNGVLQSGRLTRANINAIIATIALDFSSEEAIEILAKMQRIACTYVSKRGVSIGIDDCTIDGETRQALDEYIDYVEKVVDTVGDTGFADAVACENAKTTTLSGVLSKLTPIARRKTSNMHPIVMMSESGAKGNSINLTQIRAAVGQQTVNGKRSSGNLPCFEASDGSCYRYGFVRSSYTDGLNPAEFFFHARAGREGIVDTAVKTADTGYLGRRLAKGFESVRTHYDNSVRHANSEIIQFSYGQDGYDLSWLEKVSFSPFIKKAPSLLEVLRQTPPGPDFLEWSEASARAFYKVEIFKHIDRNMHTVFVPCDITRLIDQSQFRYAEMFPDSPLETDDDFELLGDMDSDSTAGEDSGNCWVMVRSLLDALGGPSCKKTLFLQGAILMQLGRMESFVKKCPSDSQRRWILFEILNRHERAMVSSGEMVGIMAAQSIAQPATQLTLNTFHYAGVLAFNVTLGLPRLKEITDAVNEPSRPVMVLPILDGPQSVEKPIARFLRYRTLEFYLTDNVASIDKTDCSIGFELNIERCIDDFATPEFLRHQLTVYISTNVAALQIEDLLRVESTALNCDEWWLTFRFSSVAMLNAQYASRLKKNLSKIAVSGCVDAVKITNTTIIPTSSIERFSPFHIPARRLLTSAGSNLLAVFSRNFLSDSVVQFDSLVDVYGAYSNNIHEVCRLLGIEAANRLIFSELRQVLSIDGTFVHDRHFQMIADIMTTRGFIVPLSRHGLNKNMSTGILARASFEATVDQLLEGACRNEVDNLDGVSENIFVGLTPPMGTGTFGLKPHVKNNNMTIVEPVLLSESSTMPTDIVFVKKIQCVVPGSDEIQGCDSLSYNTELQNIFQLVNLIVPFSATPFSTLMKKVLEPLTSTLTGKAHLEKYSVESTSEIISPTFYGTDFDLGRYRPSSPVPYPGPLKQDIGQSFFQDYTFDTTIEPMFYNESDSKIKPLDLLNEISKYIKF